MVLGHARRHSLGERHHRRCSISPAASRPRWSSARCERSTSRPQTSRSTPLPGTSSARGWFGVMPLLPSAIARAGRIPATISIHQAPSSPITDQSTRAAPAIPAAASRTRISRRSESRCRRRQGAMSSGTHQATRTTPMPSLSEGRALRSTRRADVPCRAEGWREPQRGKDAHDHHDLLAMRILSCAGRSSPKTRRETGHRPPQRGRIDCSKRKTFSGSYRSFTRTKRSRFEP
jgi:hypothetical protein